MVRKLRFSHMVSSETVLKSFVKPIYGHLDSKFLRELCRTWDLTDGHLESEVVRESYSIWDPIDGCLDSEFVRELYSSLDPIWRNTFSLKFAPKRRAFWWGIGTQTEAVLMAN